MTENRVQTWKCDECGDTFETNPHERHVTNSCECGDAWVDHETYQIRHSPQAIAVQE